MGELKERWHSIGTARCLMTDVDIACFLVQHYEDATSRSQSAVHCTLCHFPLTLHCPNCGPPSSLASSATTSTTSFPREPYSEEGEPPLAGTAPRQRRMQQQKETLSSVDGTVICRLGQEKDLDCPSFNKMEQTNNNDNAAYASNYRGTEVTLVNISTSTEGSDQGAETSSSMKLSSSSNKNGVEISVESREESRNEHNSRGAGSCKKTGGEKKEGMMGGPCFVNHLEGNKNTMKAEAWTGMAESHAGESQHLSVSDSLTQIDPLTIHTQTYNSSEELQCDMCRVSFLLPGMLEEHRTTSCQAHPDLITHSVWKASVTNHGTHSAFPSAIRENECSALVAEENPEPCLDNPVLDVEITGNPDNIKQSSTLDAVCEEILLPGDSNLYDCDTDVELDLVAHQSKREPNMQQTPAAAQQENLERCNTGIQEDCESSLQEDISMHADVDTFRKTDRVSVHGCQHCGQIFSSLGELVSHVDSPCRSSHTISCTNTVIQSYTGLPTVAQGQDIQDEITSKCCEHCDKTFLSPDEQRYHMLSHIDKQELNSRTASKKTPQNKSDSGYACDSCSVAFITLTRLRQHKKKEHNDKSKFQCRFCGKVLCNMQTRANHERIHTGAKPFQCSQCPSTFRSSSNLRAHLRTHSGHKPYLCPQCGRGFKEITHLKRHLVSHSGQKPYKCQQCGKAYVHATSLKEHQLSHCSSPRDWVCHQCGKAFITAKNLKAHLKTHDDCGVKRKLRVGACSNYACHVCGATYRQASSLSRHKKIHRKATPEHVCTSCGKIFRDRYELNRHSSIHSSLAPFQCPQCPRSYQGSASYRRHMLSHSQSMHHTCPHCQKSFANSKKLMRHIRTHSEVRSHTCSQCLKTFFTMWTLHLHLQQHSEEGALQIRSHICQQCGASYLHASSLVRHQRLHEAATGRGSRYHCAQCSRSFGDSSHLKRHLLSHSGEKPFVCSACGKAYADSHTLKDHMQVHTGVRSFICEMCGKAFYNSKTLKEHARSHSDRRPFQCSLCPASYKHLSGLISHRRLHTGVRPFSCGECGKAFKDYTCYKRHLLTHSHHKPHVCQQCGKGYKDLKNLRHHQTQLHGNLS